MCSLVALLFNSIHHQILSDKAGGWGWVGAPPTPCFFFFLTAEPSGGVVGKTQWNICDGRFLWDNPDDTQHHSPPVTSLPLTNLVSSLLLSLVLTAQGISYQILFQKVWIGKRISPSLSSLLPEVLFSIMTWIRTFNTSIWNFLSFAVQLTLQVLKLQWQVYLFNNVEHNWRKLVVWF